MFGAEPTGDTQANAWAAVVPGAQMPECFGEAFETFFGSYAGQISHNKLVWITTVARFVTCQIDTWMNDRDSLRLQAKMRAHCLGVVAARRDKDIDRTSQLGQQSEGSIAVRGRQAGEEEVLPLQ